MKRRSEAERLFIEDVRDKKIVSRSYRNKRTHCGRGGAVRLPSDKLTKKELEKMNGQCETYRLNQPMKWHEFLAMPVEHQISYIKKLRAQFDVPDTRIARMMFVSQATFSQYVRKLGISPGSRPGCTKWDKDRWYLFTQGVVLSDEPATSPEEELPTNSFELKVDPCNSIDACEDAPSENTISDDDADFICEQTCGFGETELTNYDERESYLPKIAAFEDLAPISEQTYSDIPTPADEFGNTTESQPDHECEKAVWMRECQPADAYMLAAAVPETGTLTFTGGARSIVNTLTALLGDTKLLHTVKWDVVD